MNTRLLTAFLIALLSCFAAGAVTIPKEHVFRFERSTNNNYICYDINLKDGALNQKEPLKAYWVLGGETRIEELTFLDRKMAFGVKVIKVNTMHVNGKLKRTGRDPAGRRPSWKKAVVTVKAGERIELA